MNLKSAVLAMVAVASILPAVGSAQPRSAEATQALAEAKQMLGVVPAMLSDMPDENVAPFWGQLKALQLNPKTALSGKTKELIGLAVAAQVPCRYCVYAHRQFAKLNGATERELKEAVATAGLARELSTLANGPSAKKPAEGAVDAATSQEIEKAFGTTPDFLKRYPTYALSSLWRQMKAVSMNPAGAVSVKDKALISLAVVSQLPSAGCVKDYTAMARANNASEQEIQEAVAMAGLTRSASTVLNGSMPDETQWRRDIDAIVKHVSAPKRASR